jgi:two-component system KDP operon response regulator KdpE
MEIKQKILIIEDEKGISNFIKAILASSEYDTLTAFTGREACSMISSHCPDLIILDLGLPDMDGMDIISTVREWTQTPIIVISARMRESDKVAALDAGADDYITKPFGTSELLARIRTAMRHTRANSASSSVMKTGVFTAGGLTIDYNKHHVLVDGKNAHLTQNEFRIVSLLANHAGKVLTYDFILKELWGPAASGNNQVLRVHMANIRRKIEKSPADPQYIFTEVGVGYRMIEGD